jgi:succinoglycan biosynthesis protein ExoA
VIRKHRSLASWRHVVPAMFVSSALLSLVLVAIEAALGISRVAAGMATMLAAGMLLYLLACAVSTFPYIGSIDRRALLILPGVIAVYHVAYGLGFLAGIVRVVLHRSPEATPSPLFTALTR